MPAFARTRLYRDYHLHSNVSDGLLTVPRLVELLRTRRIAEFSLTDHDTLRGLPIARQEAQTTRLVFLPGVELTARLDPSISGSDVHMLGYGLRYEHPPANLQRELLHLQESKREIIEKRCAESVHDPIVIKKKNGDSLELMIAFTGLESFCRAQRKPILESGSFCVNEGVLCLPLLAELNRFLGITDKQNGVNIYLLVNLIKGYRGYAQLLHDFLLPFGADLSENDRTDRSRWLPERYQPYYVPAKTAVEVIKEAGGVPVIAHPGETNLSLEKVQMMSTWGVKGLEVYSAKHSPEQIAAYRKIAGTLGLFLTIGSDFHGKIMAPGVNPGEAFYDSHEPPASIEEIMAAV